MSDRLLEEAKLAQSSAKDYQVIKREEIRGSDSNSQSKDVVEIDFGSYHPAASLPGENTAVAGDTMGLGEWIHPAARSKPFIHVHDAKIVKEKLSKMVKDGLDMLQIITDFDSTLTKPEGLSSWSVLEKSKLLSAEYRDKTYVLYSKYYPIEIDPLMSYEDKCKYMVEWWAKAQDVFLEEGLRDGCFKEMVDSQNDLIIMRDGTDTLFDTCAHSDVPILIFSAGISNVIDEILKIKNIIYCKEKDNCIKSLTEANITPETADSSSGSDITKKERTNIHIIGNTVVFESESDRKVETTSNDSDNNSGARSPGLGSGGLALGFAGEPIHVLNKTEHLIHNTPYFNLVQQRKNVLLMGDSVGDAQMSLGMAHDTVLRIGFLNTGVGKKIEDHLQKYSSIFDIVVVGDGSLNVPLAIYHAIKTGNINIDINDIAGFESTSVQWT